MSAEQQLEKAIEALKGAWIILPFDRMSDSAKAEIANMVIVKDSQYQTSERTVTVT